MGITNKDVLKTVAIDVPNLKTQMDSKVSKQEMDVERKRIDNFTSLPNGSTTGDAELIDGRVGNDGVTYSNIGKSIRTQLNKKENAVGEFVRLDLTKTIGIINKFCTVQANFSYASFIEVPVSVGEVYKITGKKHSDPNNPSAFFVNSSNAFISGFDTDLKDVEVTVPNNAVKLFINGWGEFSSVALKFTKKQMSDYIKESTETLIGSDYVDVGVTLNDGNMHYNNGVETITSSTGAKYTVLSVKPNEKYKITATGFIKTLAIYDINKKDIKILADAGVSLNLSEVIIPSNAYYMVINTIGSVPMKVQKLTTTGIGGIIGDITNVKKDIDNINTILGSFENNSTTRKQLNIDSIIAKKKYDYLFHDNFTRANNTTTLGSNGDSLNDFNYSILTISNRKFGISDNAGYSVDQGLQEERAIAYTNKNVSNCTLEAQFILNSGTIGLAFRVKDLNNFLFVQQISSGIIIGKYEGGVGGNLATVSVPRFERIAIELKNERITILLDNVEFYTIYNSFNLSETKHGIYFRTASPSKIKYFGLKVEREWRGAYDDILDKEYVPFNMVKESAEKPYSLTFDKTNTNGSKSSIRCELRKSDNFKRSELSYMDVRQMCEEVFSIDVMLGDDYIVDSRPETIFQYHDTPDNKDWGSPSAGVNPDIAMYLRNGRYVWYRQWGKEKDLSSSDVFNKNYFEETDLGSYLDDIGKWVNWTVHVKWGYEEFFEPFTYVYKNGSLVYSKKGLPNTINSVNGTFLKFGAYKWEYVTNPSACESTSRTVWYDNAIKYI